MATQPWATGNIDKLYNAELQKLGIRHQDGDWQMEREDSPGDWAPVQSMQREDLGEAATNLDFRRRQAVAVQNLGKGIVPSTWIKIKDGAPSFEEWMDGGGYKDTGKTGRDDSQEAQYIGFLKDNYYQMPSQRDTSIFSKGPMIAAAIMGGAAAAGAGAAGGAGAGAAEGAAGSAFFNPGTAAEAASMSGVGSSAVGSAAGFEGFVDPWDVMGDPSAYGLSGEAASATVPAAAPAAEATGAVAPAPSAAPASPYNAGAGAFDAAGAGVTNADLAASGISSYSPQSGGLIDSILQWGKQNPLLASTAVSVGGGMLKGAFAPTPEEIANAQANAQANLDAQRLKQKQDANNLKGITQGRIKPSGKPLPRPGIIESRM